MLVLLLKANVRYHPVSRLQRTVLAAALGLCIDCFKDNIAYDIYVLLKLNV